MYKKRDGTSGIRGQLYETKLISLIHFRTKFDDSIKDYNLATNVADIGTFDDICIRAKVKIKGGSKPVAVFIQAKHREGDKVQLTLNSKNDLAKWFSSYLSIRRLFKPSNKDVLFKGKFEDIECLFVMYTTAKADDNTTEFKSEIADKLNGLIGTRDKGLQPRHKEEDIVFLCDIIMKEQFAALAVQMAKFLSDNNSDINDNSPIMSMNDELMLMYHVILEQNVLDVSEIKYKNEEQEHRVASFKKKFFNNGDEFITIFRDTLSMEMLKKRKLEEGEDNELIYKMFAGLILDVKVLSKLIGNVVTYNDKKLKLEFVSKSMSDYLKHRLEKLDVTQSTVIEAIELATKDMLKSRRFKVPAAFGNKDLTIRGKEENAEPSAFIASVVDNLKNKLVELIKASPPENIIVLDESLEKEFLQLNAGLAGIIGNILVTDANSMYLKFTDSGELLGDHAKRLYDEVHSEIPNLHDYKFHVNIKTFPKLICDCDDNEAFKILQDQVTELAEHIGNFICKEDNSIMPMNDIVHQYHVLVVQKALEVSDIQSLNEDDEHRLASFRQHFFESDDRFVVSFKTALYSAILKLKKLDESEINLAEEILISRQFKVPTAFGNKDLTIKIKKSKTERRLDHLKKKISDLIAKSNDDEKIVTLDETLDEGLLRLNGGLAGIVGNILVREEYTKLMKFTDNYESLEDLSKRLFIKLQSEIEDLHEYKFDAKVKKFPKLSFKRDKDDEKLAKDFLNKLLFFTNQADEKGVENFLKDEIEYHQSPHVNNVRVTAAAIFLQYHDTIQRWWMLKEASYLTKQSKHYENALALIVHNPLMTIISKMSMIKIKNNMDHTFNEQALKFLKIMDQPPGTFVLTESSALTVTKMIQSLKQTDHFVLDLEYILDLQTNDFVTVRTELSKTIEDKIIIVVCNNVNKNSYKKLEIIAEVLEKKRTIFVINEIIMDIMKTYFVHANNILTDEKCSLNQMSKESQNAILQNAKVLFQDIELSLDSIIDEGSMEFVEGEVLNKMMNNELIVLGKSNSDLNYEKFKHLYIDRRVIRVDDSKSNRKFRIIGRVVQTLNDMAKVALIAAKPGMGKTTLLTHLSLKTKELNPQLWIMRINLLIHSEKFSKWRDNKTNIDYLETLKFFCEVLSEKQDKTNDLSIELEVVDGNVSLKSCTGDQCTVFELKMFLDYFNRKEIVFLFDGFDEICPMYTDEVTALLKAVKNVIDRQYSKRKHKMCITSRSYDNIISTLEKEFGMSHEIQHFTLNEEKEYLLKYWKSKMNLRELSEVQRQNVSSFMEFMRSRCDMIKRKEKNKNVKYQDVLFMKVCLNFLNRYLNKEIHVCEEDVIETFNSLFADFNHNYYYKNEDCDTPLHLYLIAEYFQSQIKDENPVPNRWNLDVNMFTAYDAFIETKLKKIRFQEKNKIDLYIPDNMTIYENERELFFNKHYKLGAYALFKRDADKIFSDTELNEIKKTIDKIKEGTEKTGLVHSVANDIPTFIHMTFAEYFAVQYICNLLKTETKEDKIKSVWNFIVNVVFSDYREDVRAILDYKVRTDEDLRAKVYKHEEIIVDLLVEQDRKVLTHYGDSYMKYLSSTVKRSVLEAMDKDLSNFVSKLYNLQKFIKKSERMCRFKGLTRKRNHRYHFNQRR